MISSVSDPVGSDATSSVRRGTKSVSDSWRADTFDRDREVGPVSQAAERMLEHPPTEGDDQPGVLGERDEVAGRHEPELGMVPAHERFERDRNARSGCRRSAGSSTTSSSRSSARCRPVTRASRLRRVGRLAVGLVLDAAPAPLLGAVHRVVGLAQEVAGFGFVAMRHGHADARAHEQRLACRPRTAARGSRRRGRPRRGSRGRPSRLRRRRRTRHRRSARRVRSSQPGRHALGDLGEQPVARVVPETVVDELEPVEVEEQDDRDRGLVALANAGSAWVRRSLRSARFGRPVSCVVIGAVFEVLAGVGLLDRDRGEGDDAFEQCPDAVAVDVVGLGVEQQRERAGDGVAIRELDRNGPTRPDPELDGDGGDGFGVARRCTSSRRTISPRSLAARPDDETASRSSRLATVSYASAGSPGAATSAQLAVFEQSDQAVAAPPRRRAVSVATRSSTVSSRSPHAIISRIRDSSARRSSSALRSVTSRTFRMIPVDRRDRRGGSRSTPPASASDRRRGAPAPARGSSRRDVRACGPTPIADLPGVVGVHVLAYEVADEGRLRPDRSAVRTKG